MRKESDQIAQDSLDADSFLCERCSKINLNHILSLKSIDLRGCHIFDFRSWSEIVENLKCSLCQAFDFIDPPPFVKPSHRQSSALTAVHSKSFKRNQNSSSYEMDVLPEDSVFLTTRLEAMPSLVWRMKHIQNPRWPFTGCLGLPTALKEEGDLFMADSIGSTVDFNMLRSWIKTCEKKHGEYCAPSSTQNSTLRLIECDSRRVIRTPKSPEISTYAALSYVWGSQEPDEVCSEELPKQLPKTIEDAITVTKGLGILYLWIDRYCINQDDEGEKDNQCGLMHRIYENAHVTIIAAAGSGPDHGLSGIGSSTRSYPSVRIGSHLLVPTLPDPNLSIQAAKWSSRGWTYQERLFSRRRLIFTDHQVLFECGRARTDESEQRLRPGTELPDGDVRRSTSFSLSCMSEKCYPMIWVNIDRFSRLDLSRQEDSLNAMLGILQRYKETNWKRGVRLQHLAGLPAIKEEHSDHKRSYNHEYSKWTAAICESLGWRSRKVIERRDVPYPGFPSWPWTAWKAANYTSTDLFRPAHPRTFHWNKFISVELPDGRLVEGNELNSLLEAGHDFSRIRFIHLKAPSLNCTIFPRDLRGDDYVPAYFMGFSINLVCAIRRHETNFFCPVELTDLSVHIPEDGLRCWGIMIAENMERDRSKTLFLLVTKVKDWYERLGVTQIQAQTEVLEELVETRSFRLG